MTAPLPDFDDNWGAVGECEAGRLRGHQVWVFTWDGSGSRADQALAWEARVCPRGSEEDDNVDTFEYLFTDIGELHQFVETYEVRWLGADAGIPVVERCFPWEAERIRERSE